MTDIEQAIANLNLKAAETPGTPVSFQLAVPLQTVKLETTAKGTVTIGVAITDPDADKAAAKARDLYDALRTHYQDSLGKNDFYTGGA